MSSRRRLSVVARTKAPSTTMASAIASTRECSAERIAADASASSAECADETPPTLWNRAVALCIRAAAVLSRTDVEVAPRTERTERVLPPELRAVLPAPAVRRWTSPLPARGARCVCHTYDQPGRWMTHSELAALHTQLRNVAAASMDALPAHRLLREDTARDALTNRIVSVAVDEISGEAVGFVAMVYLPSSTGVVIHLGLTMISREYRGRRIQSPLFSRCLIAPMYNLFTLSYTVTSIAASPAGIGACADYFCDVFPTYRDESALPTPWQLRVAREILGNHRHEFACSRDAHFDERTFVVKASNDAHGGGAPEFIKSDGQFVSRYKREACNEYCARVLDIARGDELFQVGRVDIVVTTLKYLFSPSSRDAQARKLA